MIFSKGLRERFIPPGSRREAAMYTVLHGINILRSEGITSFLKRVYRKVIWQLKIITSGIRFKLTIPGDSKVIRVEDIHINPEAQPHQSKVDIVICVHNALADIQHCLEFGFEIHLPSLYTYLGR